jgi:Ig domain of plant-specific actin-binding protein
MPKFALPFAAMVAALALAGPAGAAVPGPDPSTMTVQTGDFTQVGVASSSSFSSGPLSAELRDYENSTVAGTRLPAVISLAILAPTAATASQVYAHAAASFLVAFAKSAAKHHATVRFGAPRPLTIGDQSQLLTLSASYHLKRRHRRFTYTVRLLAVVVRQDSAVGLVVAVAPVHESIRAATVQLATDMVTHMRAGQIPINEAPPMVPGPYQLNGSLTAQPGAWSGNPTGYSYQWDRCDTTGSNCQPIANATTQTYTPAPADVGSTLEVTVTATNEDGTSQTAQSAPSTVIQ